MRRNVSKSKRLKGVKLGIIENRLSCPDPAKSAQRAQRRAGRGAGKRRALGVRSEEEEDGRTHTRRSDETRRA